MSTENDVEDTIEIDDKLQRIAAEFNLDDDPLAELEPRFTKLESAGIDPFELFINRGVKSDRDQTIQGYKRTFRYWWGVMAEEGRHPACPTEAHVRKFIRYLIDERGNEASTVGEHLSRLNTAYGYWQSSRQFPHPTNYNPIQNAREDSDLNFSSGEKDYPPLPLEELRDIVDGIRHVRDRAIVVTQLKLGLRAGELCNLRLDELNIDNSELKAHYPDLGTSEHVSDHENSVYIPSDRAGNKSENSRIIPLDNDMKRVLIDYLLVRPTNGEPWVFLTEQNNTQLDRNDPNKRVWQDAFPAEYTDPEGDHDGITSHYGRHRMSSYLKIDKQVSPERVKYLRGDEVGNTPGSTGGLPHYLHVYAHEVRDVYLENIYQLLR